MGPMKRFCHKARLGLGMGRGGYCPFIAPDPHCAGLNFLTRHPTKKPSIRAGIRYTGRGKKLRVSFVQSENWNKEKQNIESPSP